ncbi:IclR family transcriptional regulator C-terminal domain-containing protein [Zwartia sp.]|uniref:IclR family transcriptional regulator n=1 Tax=Zwartia sp. TaxID=2978004 RepID=UPI0027217384|nr:IclR family transcriptional regulator C-terminal domain-containing protein [Zwartia sp.]MDO9025939.1 IclR family transcriptional regulator C-terminal domain-containing protein [Zwartia sp.]
MNSEKIGEGRAVTTGEPDFETDRETTREKGAGPSTFKRGLEVLELLRRAGEPGLTIPEIAAGARIQRSTTYRFLDVLVRFGCVSRDDTTKRYSVRPYWAAPDRSDEAVLEDAKSALRRISDLTGDSAFLICRSGADSLCLHREVGTYPLQVLTVAAGHRQPLGVGAAGLAFLAALPQEEVALLIEQNAPRLGAYGSMSAEQLQLLVNTTRDRGWSVVGNAAVQGVLGVGVALCDPNGQPILAVSVSSVIDRMPITRQKTIAEWIATALAKLSLKGPA